MPLGLEVLALFSYFSWIGLGLRYSILFFYLPQAGVIALALVSLASIILAIRKHRLGQWKAYIFFVMLALFCLVVTAASRSIVEDAIRTKIENAENRNWAEAMVERARGGYPTGVTCVLSDQAVVLIREWSFVTPDGHMPVLAWSRNSSPNSELLGNPVSCTQLQPNWSICYLAKPYQLTANANACD